MVYAVYGDVPTIFMLEMEDSKMAKMSRFSTFHRGYFGSDRIGDFYEIRLRGIPDFF